MSETNRRLHLNRKKGLIGGVCAGLADYFGIEPFFIRLAFVIATIAWPPTIFIYGLLYFCLNDKPTSEIASNLANSRVCRHLKQVNYRKRLYKSRRNKKIAGVCAGLADYFEISPFWVRLAFVVSLFFGPFAIFAYILAALIMDKEPLDAKPQSYADATRPAGTPQPDRPLRKRDFRDCSEKFADLEKKLQRLEAAITSKKFKLHREFSRM